MTSTPIRIGDVTVKFLSEKSAASRDYSDGPVENDMLALVMSPDYATNREQMLANSPSWPMYYHFSPVRANIINWKTFLPSTRILEIGAGCGAITESLLEVVDDSVCIDALELSEKRAMINAYRNKSKKNLQILVGNLEEFSASGYDYVICVGVLEYAGKFISDEEPFRGFLEKLRSFLKPGGELILAIENKLGLKYFNGAREDHVGRYYESLMDYPQYTGIRTFSKKELRELLRDAGYKELEFYIPVPDYKIPSFVINERIFEEGVDMSFLSRSAPAPSYDQPRIHSSSEQLLTRTVVEAGLYGDLSNSFLVRCKG